MLFDKNKSVLQIWFLISKSQNWKTIEKKAKGINFRGFFGLFSSKKCAFLTGTFGSILGRVINKNHKEVIPAYL